MAQIDPYAWGVRHKADADWFERNKWDVYIYAHNDTSRVKALKDLIDAARKIPVIVPEYGYTKTELDAVFNSSSYIDLRDEIVDENEVAKKVVAELDTSLRSGGRVAIDITGFMRPHIFSILFHLKKYPGLYVDFFYAEPGMYEKKEKTVFSCGHVREVRQVSGFQGVHEEDDAEEVLVVGVGYDNGLISRVINDKERAKVYKILPFPSLSADMYQQGLLQLDKCSFSESQSSESLSHYASAKDPFSVASELSRIYWDLIQKGLKKNVYLCSLATKPQALGFAIFYLNELEQEPVSVLFPYSSNYSKETSQNVGDIWRYKVVM
ncbi:MAG: hypothetical protein KBT87_07495 [Gammaproteobacteria bacterium]|nr:hypothetical protein [Gammaproteobacteria bacterium]MBQ0774496.1 hypothetical protein [Gammaproteobacteria bacterium]